MAQSWHLFLQGHTVQSLLSPAITYIPWIHYIYSTTQIHTFPYRVLFSAQNVTFSIRFTTETSVAFVQEEEKLQSIITKQQYWDWLQQCTFFTLISQRLFFTAVWFAGCLDSTHAHMMYCNYLLRTRHRLYAVFLITSFSCGEWHCDCECGDNEWLGWLSKILHSVQQISTTICTRTHTRLNTHPCCWCGKLYIFTPLLMRHARTYACVCDVFGSLPYPPLCCN